MSSKVSTTINLSDTIDQWSRKVHINIRNGKVTAVFRWKSRDGRDHTQRITFNDTQVGRLSAALTMAADKAVGDNDVRRQTLLKGFRSEVEK